MQTYKSIASAVKIFPTANKPILISVNDRELRLWVVKSCRGKLPAYGLAKELLAYRFAEIWNINQPKAALISVNSKHLEKLNISNDEYSHICFGSQYLVNRQDWDKFMERASKGFYQKFKDEKDLLKISLFDLWLGNEDRFAQNHNLLLELTDTKYQVLPIDHETILNATDSNNNKVFYDSEMMLPDDGHNLLESLSVMLVLRKCKSINELKAEVVGEFSNFVEDCKVQLTEIINEIPDEWELEKKLLTNYLMNELFKNSWTEVVKERFIYLLAKAKLIKSNY